MLGNEADSTGFETAEGSGEPREDWLEEKTAQADVGLIHGVLESRQLLLDYSYLVLQVIQLQETFLTWP